MLMLFLASHIDKYQNFDVYFYFTMSLHVVIKHVYFSKSDTLFGPVKKNKYHDIANPTISNRKVLMV